MGISSSISKLRSLRDVNLTGLDDGETLLWDAATNKFVAGSAGASVSGRIVYTAAIVDGSVSVINTLAAPTFEQTDVSSIRTSVGFINTGGDFATVEYTVTNYHSTLTDGGTVFVFVKKMGSTDYRVVTASYNPVDPGGGEFVLDFTAPANSSSGTSIGVSGDSNITLSPGSYELDISCTGVLYQA
jgi:hypothetical protein